MEFTALHGAVVTGYLDIEIETNRLRSGRKMMLNVCHIDKRPPIFLRLEGNPLVVRSRIVYTDYLESQSEYNSAKS